MVSMLVPTLAWGGEKNEVPRYDKTKQECQNFKPCLDDYYIRRRCFRKPSSSVAQNKCYIRYAARYYRQLTYQALAVGKCESTFDEKARNGRFRGLFQIGGTEWYDTPFGQAKRKVRVAYRAKDGSKRKRTVIKPRYSRTDGKYNSLAAMWYWKRGEQSRWECYFKLGFG